jgi:hypothetical protein
MRTKLKKKIIHNILQLKDKIKKNQIKKLIIKKIKIELKKIIYNKL